MRRLLPLLCVPLLACPPTLDRRRLRVAVRVPAVEGVTWSEGTWDGRAIRLRPCPSDTDPLGWPGLPAAADGIAAPPEPTPWTIGLEDPLGVVASGDYARGLARDWCAVDLIGRGVLAVTGEGPQGAVSLTIDVPDFEATGLAASPHGFAEDEEGPQPAALMVRLGGPVFAAEVEALVQAGPVEVTPDSPEHDALQVALVQEVAAWVDADDDRQITGADGSPWVMLAVVVPGG